MRPVRLVVEGFTAFRDRTEIDFTDADYFVLVGPTGSGKSSVLDAICFALYGSVPRYDDDRLVVPAITQGANEGRVSLTFDIDGDEYLATRVVRRTKTGATTKEARLERGSDVLAGDAREMNAAVAELIGLPFRHFTQCVVLPQGEFARFLHDTPSDRQALLVKLLDLGVYDRMRQAAGARAKEGANTITLDQQRLDGLAGCTPEAERDARAAVTALKQLRAQLEKGEAELGALEKAAGTAAQDAAAALDTVRHLEAVKVPAGVRTLGEQRAAAVTELDQATRRREQAEKDLTRQGEAVDRLADPAPLHVRVEEYKQLDELRPRLAELEAAARDALPTLDAARAELEAATHSREHAEMEYDAAVEETVATQLAAALVEGEPCPVCEQVVTKKPRVRLGDKERARKARDVARKKEGALRAKLDDVVKRSGGITANLDALQEQCSALRAKLAGAPPLHALEEQIAQVGAARARHKELQLAAKQATIAERDARAEIDGIDRKLADARKQCERQRDPLVRAGLEVPGMGTDLVASWVELATWAAAAAPAHKQRAAEQEQRAAEQSAAAREAFQQLMELCEHAGVVVPARPAPTIGSLRERAAAAEQAASAEVERVVTGIREAAVIAARLATVHEQVEVAAELARLLHSNRFEQWIVNEALEILVEGASGTLEQLSNGQYALSVDDHNEFEVIDHRNADERRPVKTLSGGETFQAALALALALADHVGSLAADGAAKLDAIFLDEGFGTLDAESLDTVAATLETLGRDGRMVGIVTHVRDLAERVPVRYEVVKGPRTAAVTRVDA